MKGQGYTLKTLASSTSWQYRVTLWTLQHHQHPDSIGLHSEHISIMKVQGYTEHFSIINIMKVQGYTLNTSASSASWKYKVTLWTLQHHQHPESTGLHSEHFSILKVQGYTLNTSASWKYRVTLWTLQHPESTGLHLLSACFATVCHCSQKVGPQQSESWTTAVRKLERCSSKVRKGRAVQFES